MRSFFSRIRVSRIFLLSVTFLTFVIFFISTIFSTFIYNNTKQQLIESLYIQAKAIDKLVPELNALPLSNYDAIVNKLDIEGTNEEKLRVTIIDKNWTVVGDSFIPTEKLSDIEIHSPETRLEIKNALLNSYGTATRISETTGEELIYVAILRDPNDQTKGLIRVALPFNYYTSIFNFFIYPFIILLILVIASSSFLSFNVQTDLRKNLDSLLRNTQKALKGKRITESLGKKDTQIGSIADAVNNISIRLNSEIQQTVEQRKEFGNVLDNVNQGVIIFNKNFKVRFSNDIALEMFGKHQFFLNEKIKSKKLIKINKLLKSTKDNLSAESELSVKLSGEDKNFLLSATKMETTNEYILVINDISSLRKLEELRKQFVTDISHEIKTPISVIRANSETLSSTGAIKDPKLAEKFLNSILNNSERLSAMLDDLLELEKIEFGGLVLNRKKFNVYDQIDLILESQQALADENNIIITNYIDKNISLKVDKDSFTTIFSNLINNSIKYSRKDGNVAIKALQNKDALIISITDKGLGIEKQYLNKVFNRFYRTPKARANTKGTGLGLSLVKQLASRMNAETEVESKIGKGTTVFVTFPT
ncbi:MAG: hypothetical protein CMQ75_01405 [Gammaproteobacteria bacterium]|nr:hypothetical protein [Gammaproteobacteria bacterium]|tara:strand:- start:13311 stop:15089 length:1779 start_codon:yes stop_codon:yes gene_type:complete